MSSARGKGCTKQVLRRPLHCRPRAFGKDVSEGMFCMHTTPPPVRGKGYLGTDPTALARPLPARAGKTAFLRRRWSARDRRPRACGKDLRARRRCRAEGPSPARVRAGLSLTRFLSRTLPLFKSV